MAHRSHQSIRDSNTLTERYLSFHLFCVDILFDVLRVVVMLVAIYALQRLIGFLFPVSPTVSVWVLEIFHEVVLVVSGAIIAFRRLKSLVRGS